jgi:exopolyphosphatase/guanosine-5'-triphosphate,3'-diphosphate pyrophosphatase
MSSERAIIDIGSNTLRLVIFDGPRRAPVVVHNEKVTARLGKGVADGGQLTGKAMGVALRALRRYAGLLELRGVFDVQTVATAAVRDAANGGQFLDAVRETGLSPRLLSGEEEALTSAAGIVGAFPGAKGVVADLGGGSLELVHVAGAVCERGASLPFGTLWLPQLRAEGADRFARRVRKALVATEWHCTEGEALYLVGGSHRALGRLAMRQADWPLDDPHGFELATEAMQHVCRSAMRGGVPTSLPGVSASRLAVLPDTAALLSVLLREIRPSSVVFSAWGLREGLLYLSLDEADKARDPLTAGVSAFVESLGSAPETGTAVARWIGQAPPAASPAAEQLRRAAAMLILAAQRIEPNLRAAHALDWALHKRWIGLGEKGRAMIAASVTGNAGRDDWPAELGRLAAQEDLRTAHAWGLAIRLCRRFSALSPAVLAQSALTAEGGKLVLSHHPALAPLVNEGTEKDLRTLAEHLGLEPCLQPDPDRTGPGGETAP